MASWLSKLGYRYLKVPELRDVAESEFDTAEVTGIQRRIIATKPALRALYAEYCRPVVESALRAPIGAKMLEIGSGASPLTNYLTNLVSTDVVHLPWLDLVCSAYSIPFKDKSLDRIFAVFVCHHLGRLHSFLNEVHRCLKPSGEIVIVDPAVTWFSRWYYRLIHMDAMDETTEEWGFDGAGRLSDSNIALAWIVFVRDRERLMRLYPDLRIEKIEYNTCLSFLLSGGTRIRQLAPTFVIRRLFALENWVIRHVTSQVAVTMAVTIKRLPQR